MSDGRFIGGYLAPNQPLLVLAPEERQEKMLSAMAATLISWVSS